jgi:Zn-dependent M28 family amino/carboxypeptidase
VAGIIHRGPNGAQNLVGHGGATRVRKVGWVAGDPLVSIPFFSSTWATAQILRANLDVPVNWTSASNMFMVTTYNVIAETRFGDPDNVILAGAHLDSAAFTPPPLIGGPGLNDNGSGSALILEMAIQLVSRPTRNRVRFAWWGAEEDGLLGSYHYVNQLSEHEKSVLLATLNHDMMASPNGFVQVYNGSHITAIVDCCIPPISDETKRLSEKITRMYMAHYDNNRIPYELVSIGTGSDYFPFIMNNITAGALATGASEIKTEAQRTRFGGFASTQLDPCYHIPCDTIDNINEPLLQIMANAASSVLYSLAMDGLP